LQKQGRKLFVFAQESFDVILHLNTGMDNRPKMGGSDKSKKRQDILEALAAKVRSIFSQQSHIAFALLFDIMFSEAATALTSHEMGTLDADRRRQGVRDYALCETTGGYRH